MPNEGLGGVQGGEGKRFGAHGGVNGDVDMVLQVLLWIWSSIRLGRRVRTNLFPLRA